MKVFISWSNPLSGAVAHILHRWLPKVIQDVEPFLSSEDIRKGGRWLHDISKSLSQSQFGILCMTKQNIAEPWILFEAGALSKTLDESTVCPLLVDIRKSDLTLPLSQFQASEFTEADVKKMCVSVFENLPESRLSREVFDATFEKWWPDLDSEVKQEIENSGDKHHEADESKFSQKGAYDHIMTTLEEIYDAVKAQSNVLGNPERLIPRDYVMQIAAAIERGDRVMSKADNRHPAVKIMIGEAAKLKNTIQATHLSTDEKFRQIQAAADEIERMLTYWARGN